MMFELAIKARIPIICIQTTDILHLQEVIEFYSPNHKVGEWRGTFPAGVRVVYAVQEYEPTLQTYNTFNESEKILILVNQGKDSPYVFDVGIMPTPKELVSKVLKSVVGPNRLDALVSCFKGLTLKEVENILRLTGAAYQLITPVNVRLVRSMVMGSQQGLDSVSTDLGVYVCPPELEKWVTVNRPYFIGTTDHKLVPRGLLFKGMPGVGKTMGAKYVATRFGVQLYRLDMASSLGKYVGQSESNLSRVLSVVDQEEPCVLLIDELEKLFAESDDSGVTSRLLSQLLWWLQEHKSRVVTVMTTNDVTAIPPELYRPGRVDMILMMEPLLELPAKYLALEVFDQFKTLKDKRGAFRQELTLEFKSNTMFGRAGDRVAPATIVQLVYSIIKRKGWLL